MVAVGAGCVIVVVVVASLAVDWLTLRWTIVGILGLGALAALYVLWTTRNRNRPLVPACKRCNRPAHAGLYCAFCGAQHVLDSPRALDDLSIEISGGATAVLLPYGTPLPFTKSEVFSTADDDQQSVGIHLVTGTATSPLRKTIANVTSRLVMLRPRAIPQISITLTVDAGGELELEINEVGTDNTVRSVGHSIAVSEVAPIATPTDPN